MNDSLNIYHISGFHVDMDSNCMTIKGVQLEEILNEYSTEDIVDALFNTDKASDALDLIVKTNENGWEE